MSHSIISSSSTEVSHCCSSVNLSPELKTVYEFELARASPISCNMLYNDQWSLLRHFSMQQ